MITVDQKTGEDPGSSKEKTEAGPSEPNRPVLFGDLDLKYLNSELPELENTRKYPERNHVFIS